MPLLIDRIRSLAEKIVNEKGIELKSAYPFVFSIGAGGRNRTDMELPPEDFESSASTNFTTPARSESYTNVNLLSSEKAE